MGYKKIIKLSIPVFISFFSYHILGITDVIMVGRLGKEALASTGIVLTIVGLFINPLFGVMDSTTVIMSKLFGKNDFELLKKTYFHIIYLFLFAGFFMIFLLIVMIPLLNLFSNDKVVINGAIPYMIVITLALIPFFVAEVINTFFISIQRSKLVAISSNVATFINILLNYILIFGKFGFPKMGILGAGVATLISRMFQMFINMYLAREEFKRIGIEYRYSNFDLKIMDELMKNGMPLFQANLVELGSWTVFTALISRLGSLDMATHQVAMKVKDIGYLFIWAVSVVNSSLIGESVGKEDINEINLICSKSLKISVVFMVFFSLLIFFFSRPILIMFTDDNDVINSGDLLLKIMAFYQINDAMFVILRSSLVGVGNAKVVRNSIFFGGWFIMLPIAFVLTRVFNFRVYGAWIGLVVYVFFISIVFYIFFFKKLIFKKNMV